MKENTRRYIRNGLRAASIVLALKGAIGGSLATLALFGVAVPFLGVEPTPVGESLAATVGAVLGVIAAFRA